MLLPTESSGKSLVFNWKWVLRVLGDTHCFLPYRATREIQEIKINVISSFLNNLPKQCWWSIYLWEWLKQARQPKPQRVLSTGLILSIGVTKYQAHKARGTSNRASTSMKPCSHSVTCVANKILFISTTLFITVRWLSQALQACHPSSERSRKAVEIVLSLAYRMKTCFQNQKMT